VGCVGIEEGDIRAADRRGDLSSATS